MLKQTPLNPLQNRVHHIIRAALSTEVRRQHLALPDHRIHRSVNSISTLFVPKMTQHQSSRTNGSQRVRDSLALNVRRGAVDTREDRVRNGGRKYVEGGMSKRAHGSPMTKLSPAFTEGTKPSEPTSAAAASLVMLLQFRSS